MIRLTEAQRREAAEKNLQARIAYYQSLQDRPPIHTLRTTRNKGWQAYCLRLDLIALVGILALLAGVGGLWWCATNDNCLSWWMNW